MNKINTDKPLFEADRAILSIILLIIFSAIIWKKIENKFYDKVLIDIFEENPSEIRKKDK